MKILPDSQINNLPILEEVLEELRLNIIDHLQYLADARYLYSLNSDELKQKLGLLGLTSINIGKFISLDLSQDIFQYISPEFYKMYRKLNQHRGNKMSMDYIFHSAGMMNTLVHSNDQYYNATNIFDDVGSFFDFNTFRDNQFPELEIGDGYIIVPYTSNKVQLLKQYLATNPIIFSFLPAGYTFIFLSDYRNSFGNGALQYDNVLNYLDNQEVLEYLKQLYWEPYEHYTAEEQIIYPNHPDDEVTYTHDLYYYDPIYFRDLGYPFFINFYSRFEDDSLYVLPYGDDLHTFNTLEEYLAYYTMLLMDSVLTDYEHGLEADLNNPLFYKDVWVGDHLVSYLLGENVESEYPDHVKGLKAIQNPSYSYASLYDRGQSLASQYLQRENGIISKTDVLIQEHKPEIISDRREMDLFKIVFNDEYSLWLIAAYTPSQASLLLQNVMGIDANLADLIVSNMPSLIQNSLDYDVAEYYFNQLVSSLTSNDTIFEVRDNGDNVVLTNASSHNTHTEEITSNNYIPSYTASMNKVDLGSSTPITTYTLSYVNTQLPDITITMPSSEICTSGTVVTLPTMSGEYESDGKTWIPSSWDIGAFGSSYTIEDNVTAYLIFIEKTAHSLVIIWDDTSGDILSSFFYEAIIGLSSSVPIETFYFTQNGIDEEEDSLLPTMGYDLDLYDADGNRAADPSYNNVRPLTYMHVDGNMFPYGDDTIIINSGADLLGLMSDEEDNRTAWSAQVEKIFRVSFTQTQLPDITVPMPSDLRGIKGASVTLPSVSGVYQQNGKAYVPSSWNIGAFGSSYTINGDTVAVLNFSEYVIVGGVMTSTTEEVLYMDSFGNIMTTDV